MGEGDRKLGNKEISSLQSVYWESETDTWMLKLDIQSLQNYG